MKKSTQNQVPNPYAPAVSTASPDRSTVASPPVKRRKAQPVIQAYGAMPGTLTVVTRNGYPPIDTLCVVAFVIAIVGTFCLPILGTAAGLILGGFGYQNVKESRERGYGYAVAAIVIGASATVVGLLLLIAAILYGTLLLAGLIVAFAELSAAF